MHAQPARTTYAIIYSSIKIKMKTLKRAKKRRKRARKEKLVKRKNNRSHTASSLKMSITTAYHAQSSSAELRNVVS